MSRDFFKLRRSVDNNKHHTSMLATKLQAQYEHLSAWPKNGDQFVAHEHSVYSQNGEDGILLHLFSQIGCYDHRFIEFGVGDGTQCNAANLSLNFGWQGLLLEADPSMVAKAKDYYRERLGGYASNVKIVAKKVTTSTINETFRDQGFTNEIDLLSIDIDGNDYWIWEALHTVSPRIVVVEYNASWRLCPMRIETGRCPSTLSGN